MSVGPSELVVILLVVFLLFGSRRLADLGKGIGDGIRGFRRGIAGDPEADEAAKPAAEAAKEPPQLTGRVATPVELGNHLAGEADATKVAVEPSPAVEKVASSPTNPASPTAAAPEAVKPN